MKPKYKRVLLKISGEALAGESKFGIDNSMVNKIAIEVARVHELGVEVGIVVGGGNFGVAGQAPRWIKLQRTIWGCLQLL